MRKCKTHKSFADVGPYFSIMEMLAELRDLVKPEEFKLPTRRHAAKLKIVLEAVYETLEQHVLSEGKGVATLLYQELSGQASIPMVRRFVTKCLAYDKGERSKEAQPSAASASSSSPQGSSRGRGGGGGGGGRGGSSASFYSGGGASKNVRCFGCDQMGHYKDKCPLNKSNRGQYPPLQK